MMERWIHLMFVMITFIVCMDLILGLEIPYEVLMINAALTAGYVLLGLLPKFIKNLNWKTGELIISILMALGCIVLLSMVGIVNPEDGPTPIVYAIVSICIILPTLIKSILKRYIKKKGDSDENKTDV